MGDKVLGMDWETLDKFLPLVIEGAAVVMDAIVPGENVSDDGILAIQNAYCLATTVGTKLVGKTKPTSDDKALAAFIKLCEDTAREGQFPLPVLTQEL